MNGVHDLGGYHGFGKIDYDPDEPTFHEPWEGRVFGMAMSVAGSDTGNIDAIRFRAEQLDPVAYFKNGYFGRWLASMEVALVRDGLLSEGELDGRVAGDKVVTPASDAIRAKAQRDGPPNLGGHIREVNGKPKFKEGQVITTRNHQPAGHTRLPAYARAKRGKISIVFPAMVFPDTNAIGKGENPQYLYNVEFEGRELWGDSAEPGTQVRLDLFESYLEAV